MTVRDLVAQKHKEFLTLTNINRDFTNKMLTTLTGSYHFDIFEFEDYCRYEGYDEEKYGSLYDYIVKKYGQETADWIESNL